VALVAIPSRPAISLLISALAAQVAYNPYSGYGVGLPALPASGAGLGTGRLSVAGLQVPLPEQPAHSAHLTAMQADFSGYGRSAHLQSPTQKGRFGTGGLQNLQLSFARGKGWGFSFGLAPQALQGYQGRLTLQGPLPLQYQDKTEGLLSLAYIQTALRWRHVALGYQLGYLWGTYERQQSLQTTSQALPDYLITRARLNGLQHRIGLAWQDTFGSHFLQISLAYTFSPSLSRELSYTFQKNFSYSHILVDTLALSQERWTQGAQWRGGLFWQGASWQAGLEGGYQASPSAWGGHGLVPASGRPSWDIRGGLSWAPDPRSATFYKRFRYQLGGFVAAPPYAPLRWYGLTAGLGWQLPRSPHLLFLALERGWLPTPILQESYWQVSLAVVFRELWFVPPRLD